MRKEALVTGSVRRLLCCLTSIVAVSAALSALSTGAAAAAADYPGPPLLTPKATLQAALSCSADLATASKTPILLTPGTFETPTEVYSWGYQKVLRGQGHPVCTVTLPGGGVQDMQITVEYVVNAIRYMRATSGRKISIIGHSQGGLLNAWALRFWPDLPGDVDDAISLGSPYRGSQVINALVCVVGVCPPVAWQGRAGSRWSAAVTRAPIATGPSITSIGSTTDELVQPAPVSTQLPGATNLEIQDLCPLRVVGHLGEVADAAAFALVEDALTHPGAASLTRAATTSCSRLYFDGIDSDALLRLLPTAQTIVDDLLASPYVFAEPALRDYATT
jgi:triacylglycerol lipase